MEAEIFLIVRLDDLNDNRTVRNIFFVRKKENEKIPVNLIVGYIQM